jgi:hypothetical protein
MKWTLFSFARSRKNRWASGVRRKRPPPRALRWTRQMRQCRRPEVVLEFEVAFLITQVGSIPTGDRGRVVHLVETSLKLNVAPLRKGHPAQVQAENPMAACVGFLDPVEASLAAVCLPSACFPGGAPNREPTTQKRSDLASRLEPDRWTKSCSWGLVRSGADRRHRPRSNSAVRVTPVRSTLRIERHHAGALCSLCNKGRFRRGGLLLSFGVT